MTPILALLISCAYVCPAVDFPSTSSSSTTAKTIGEFNIFIYNFNSNWINLKFNQEFNSINFLLFDYAMAVGINQGGSATTRAEPVERDFDGILLL